MSNNEQLSKVNTLLDNLAKVEENIKLLTENTNVRDFETLSDQLTLIESSKLNLALAFSLGSLYFALLNTNNRLNQNEHGESINHPIKNELNRIKEYVAKLSKIENDIKEERSIILNKEAAKRVIEHSLAINDSNQTKKLKH
jgi:hypothetical protein